MWIPAPRKIVYIEHNPLFPAESGPPLLIYHRFTENPSGKFSDGKWIILHHSKRNTDMGPRRQYNDDAYTTTRRRVGTELG